MGRRLVALAVTLVALAPPAAGLASEPLWSLLARGGHVVLIRHTITTPGVGDPDGMRLDDCGTQRNLTDEGRRHAQRIGEAFRARAVAVERVLSSPWCRCLETARLAFGAAEVSRPLANLFGRAENRSRQIGELTPLVAERPGTGTLVLVSHGSTIQALTGVMPGTGEIVVLVPQGGGRFAVAGRLSVP
jgi:broad specificity phosphatase PhoE